MSENGEIYSAGKNFTLPPALTAWTNSTSGFEGLVLREPRDLRAEKQAPERVVSRWFLSAGNIDDVSRLNRGFGFIRSWMKAKKTFLKRCVSAIVDITCTC